MKATATYPAPAAPLTGEVRGAGRLRGRTQDELGAAMTWLAWRARGGCLGLRAPIRW